MDAVAAAELGSGCCAAGFGALPRFLRTDLSSQCSRRRWAVSKCGKNTRPARGFAFFFLNNISTEVVEVAVGGVAFCPFCGLLDGDVSRPAAEVVKAKKSTFVHSCVWFEDFTYLIY